MNQYWDYRIPFVHKILRNFDVGEKGSGYCRFRHGFKDYGQGGGDSLRPLRKGHLVEY